MLLTTLRKKAANNTLEVEHLLAAARKRVPGLQEELARLSVKHGWSPVTHPAGGSHVPPFAKWADIAGAYGQHGLDGLAPLAHDADSFSYVLAMLEEVRTAAAVDALLAWYSDLLCDPARNVAQAVRLAGACNILLSFKGCPVPTEAQAATIRQFLMLVLLLVDSTPERSAAICALRGVGDAATVVVLNALAELPYPFHTVRPVAIRAILRRLRASNTALAPPV